MLLHVLKAQSQLGHWCV